MTVCGPSARRTISNRGYINEQAMTFALLTVLCAPLAGWVAVRMMEHIERMEMIRRGMIPPAYGSAFPTVAPLPNHVAQAYLRRAITVVWGAVAVLAVFAFAFYPR